MAKEKKSFESKQSTRVETYYGKEAVLRSRAAALSHRGLFLVPQPETLERIVSFWKKKKWRRKPSGAICLKHRTNRGPLSSLCDVIKHLYSLTLGFANKKRSVERYCLSGFF